MTCGVLSVNLMTCSVLSVKSVKTGSVGRPTPGCTEPQARSVENRGRLRMSSTIGPGQLSGEERPLALYISLVLALPLGHFWNTGGTSGTQVNADLDPALDGAVGDDVVGGRVDVQLGPGAHAVHRPRNVLQAALALSLHGDLCPRS